MTAIAVMHSGRKVDVAAPHPSMFSMRDIAAHLAKQCMYAGATQLFYSRAQRGVIAAGMMASLEGPIGALYGLLQNAHFAVDTADELSAAKVARAIHEAIDLDWPPPETITKALAQVLDRLELGEITQLMTGWSDRADELRRRHVIPLRTTIRPMTWDRAMDRWMEALTVHAVAANIPHLPALGEIL